MFPYSVSAHYIYGARQIANAPCKVLFGYVELAIEVDCAGQPADLVVATDRTLPTVRSGYGICCGQLSTLPKMGQNF